MNLKKLLVSISLIATALGFSAGTYAAGFTNPTQSFIGEYGGTYYDFSIVYGDPNHAPLNTIYMPWFGSGQVLADEYLSAALASATTYSGNLNNAHWLAGNEGDSVYAFNYRNGGHTLAEAFYKSGGSYTSNAAIPAGSAVYYLAATAVTGGATPSNLPSLNGYVLPVANYFYDHAPGVGGVAPEMNASFIPQVALMLGCLFFLLGRKKENTESMMTA